MAAIFRDGQIHVTCDDCGTELILDADQAARLGTWIGAATDHGWTIRDGGLGESSCPRCWDDTPVTQAEVTERPAGCCTSCDGTGIDNSAPETNGKCWDCRGTGHPHDGPCATRADVTTPPHEKRDAWPLHTKPDGWRWGL